MIELLPDILKDLYHFYPVGIGNYKSYPGLLEMREIVSNKMDNECNDPESISNRFNISLQKELPDLKVLNMNYYNFPNYVDSIQINNRLENDIEHSFSLEIFISLLTDYYTLFFADNYWVNKGSERATVFSVYSFQKSLTRIDKTVYESTTRQVNLFFPKKKYIPHIFLFNTRINGSVPFGEEWSPIIQENNYSLFQLLFHYGGFRIDNSDVFE